VRVPAEDDNLAHSRVYVKFLTEGPTCEDAGTQALLQRATTGLDFVRKQSIDSVSSSVHDFALGQYALL
jgi:hypothetical protein